MWFKIFKFVDFPMSKLAHSLEHARLAIEISGEKTVYRLEDIKSCDFGVLKLPYRNDSTIAEFLLRRY